jgi:hypothetical protein
MDVIVACESINALAESGASSRLPNVHRFLQIADVKRGRDGISSRFFHLVSIEIAMFSARDGGPTDYHEENVEYKQPDR